MSVFEIVSVTKVATDKITFETHFFFT